MVERRPLFAARRGQGRAVRRCRDQGVAAVKAAQAVDFSSPYFDVTQAVDGQDGLDVLEGMANKPDVIITDINMPRMDGYEVIRNLRKNPAHKSTPILVLTTESEADKKNLAREAGATGWMVKPFDADRLIATVRKVIP